MPCPVTARLLGLGLLALAAASPALAQGRPPSAPPSSQSLDTSPSCQDSGKATAATPPAPGRSDSTAPGNAGNTGWSGGTGGSQIGTNPSGATPSSPTWQPETARGLDPIAAPARPAPVC